MNNAAVAHLLANKSAFLAACASRPRADLLAEMASFVGPAFASAPATQSRTDAEIASILWSLRGMALARAGQVTT